MAARLTTLRPRVALLQPSRVQPLTVRAESRLSTSEWEALRKLTLTIDNGLCRCCKAEGRLTAAREVDHIRPLWAGGTNDPANLQSLCTPCHAAKTAKEAAERSRGHPDQGEPANAAPSGR